MSVPERLAHFYRWLEDQDVIRVGWTELTDAELARLVDSYRKGVKVFTPSNEEG